VARLIQAHAEVVNLFVKNGFGEPHKNHAVPKRDGAVATATSGVPTASDAASAPDTDTTCPAGACPTGDKCPAGACPAAGKCPAGACPTGDKCPAGACPAGDKCPGAANCPQAEPACCGQPTCQGAACPLNPKKPVAE
jgi:hypothetical protein